MAGHVQQFRCQSCAPQAVRKLRSTRLGTSRHAACRALPGAEARHSEHTRVDVIAALMAGALTLCVAAVAEPQTAPDSNVAHGPGRHGWSQQQKTMIYYPERVSDSMLHFAILVEDAVGPPVGDDLAVPQSPNPGVPESPGGEPARPRTPSEPPENPPPRTSPFPAEPVPPIPEEPPHFLCATTLSLCSTLSL